MKTKIKIFLGLIVTVVGFAAAVVGLWDRLFPAVKDVDVILINRHQPNLLVTSELPPPESDFIKANVVTIDGTKWIMREGALLIANEIIIKNSGEIWGSDFNVVATKISGGKISTTGSIGLDGGRVLIASALLNGTVVEANGLDGRKGKDGDKGTPGADGANGRDGSCRGFGGWRSAFPGQDGAPGSDGENGEPGQNGGHAGEILILTSADVTTQPEAQGGLGGRGGKGGPGGPGGKGGRGGIGCTGLGGAQESRPPGRDGTDGSQGKDGADGQRGTSRSPSIKLVRFSVVRDLWKDHYNNKSSFLTRLRELNPH